MIAVDTAIEVACKVVGIDIEQFQAPERIEEFVDARGIAYKLMKEGNGWSYNRIGRLYGKDHTAIRHAVKRVDNSIHTRGTLGKLYQECEGRIT